jgi:D-methionine transport system substrate-binding protein
MVKKIKTLVSLTMILLLGLSLMSCGSTSSGNTPSTPNNSQAEGESQTTTIKVGASPTPHAEILEAIKPVLTEQNINLEVVVFDDYVLPNEALDNGELDANYFQHQPYLSDFNANKGTDLVSAAAVHYEPMGIYAGQVKSLDEIPDGASIAVPNDATNEARALLLLEQAGLIKVREGAGLEATAVDIIENPKNIKLQEVEAAQVSRTLPDVAVGVLNGNYALVAGLSAKDALETEDPNSIAAQTFGNILAVRRGDEGSDTIKALVAALTSDTAKQFIEKQYQGSVIPLF